MRAITNYLGKGSSRSVIVKKNIAGSLAIKSLSVLTSFVLVPYTIHLLSQEKYGIWITIFSIVNWFNMTDIGLGNGFRNKFAEALARNDQAEARALVQTLYSSMLLIGIGLLAVFFFVNPFLNWNLILNLPGSFNENINQVIAIVFFLFSCQLFFKNISTVFLAQQKTALSNSLLFFANVLSLGLLFLYEQFSAVSLYSVALIFMLSPVIVFSIATIIAFAGDLKQFAPRIFKAPSRKYFNTLMSLGFQFFLIQVTAIVMFSSSSMIITQLYGPAAVTPYNVCYQLFAAVQIVFGIVLAPFWTAFTDAHVKGDSPWIKKSLRQLLRFWILFSLGILVLFAVSPWVFQFWLGNKVAVSLDLSFQFALFAILLACSTIFSFFVAGIGKIRISLFVSLFQCIIYVPLAIVLATWFNLNTTGIILAVNVCLVIGIIFLSIQTAKIINNNAHGIWNR